MRIIRHLTLAVICTILVGADARAVLVRHDVQAEQYEANEADYPAVFGLLRTRRGFWDCPATLIAPQWAITAGHCASAPRIAEALAAGGAHAVTIAGAGNAIDRVVQNPNGADVALLHLAQAVGGVEGVPLYSGNDEIGRTVIMVGWGDTGDGVRGITGPDGRFRRATNVVDRAEADLLSWTFSEPGVDGSDATPLEGISGPGDSGGPAFIEADGALMLAGVSSAQDPMAHARGSYGVREYFVRVSAVRAWIEAEMARG